jgi:hypothetical protein
MTKEKEKAIDLIAKVEIELGSTPLPKETVKKLALIAVDEILSLHKKLPLETLEFYAVVKHEINNI